MPYQDNVVSQLGWFSMPYQDKVGSREIQDLRSAADRNIVLVLRNCC